MNDVTHINTSENSEDSIPDTLWTATLLDMLIDALRREQADAEILPLVDGLFYKQFSSRYIFSRVRRELSEAASDRLKKLLLEV
jgi:hypothetical protein